MNGYSDIASVARKLTRLHLVYGIKQIPFCKDPMAVIVHGDCDMSVTFSR
jgi:hypothetical protein